MKLGKRFSAVVRQYPAVAGLILFALGTIIYFSFIRNTASPQNAVTVARGTITESITVTGKTKPVLSVDLAFERSGAVARLRADVGDAVLPRQIILELANGEFQADLAEAEANLEGAQAKLDELKRGARPEEIRIRQTELDKANQNLANGYGAVPDTLNDAYTKADDAVRNQLDGFFTEDETSNPRLSFPTASSQIQRDVETGRVIASAELNAWKNELGILDRSSSKTFFDHALASGKTHLAKIQAFLDETTDALNGGAGLLSQSAFTAHKTSLTAARNEVNAALTSAISQEQSIASNKIAVQQLTDELNLDLAGSTPESIAAQDALVKQALARKNRAEVNLSKTMLRSPIAGIVTRQDGKVGEIAAANSPIVSVISQNKLEIEAHIPEVDIVKIMLRDPAAITVDAFPNETFSGKIVEIDPAETVIDGVVNFKVVIDFDATDPRMKSGLTANLRIETKKKTGVLVLPEIAILQNDLGSFVQKYENGKTTEVPVVLGIRDQNGNVEILSGVALHDTVLNIGLKTQ